jgi:hypothetical protein
MTTALAPATLWSTTETAELGDGARRLDQAITVVWDRLGAQVEAECPVCGGRMQPQYGAGARPIAGRCSDCGSYLS